MLCIFFVVYSVLGNNKKMNEESKHVIIYTDGACDPNPGGPGGYGVILTYEGRQKEISNYLKTL